MALSARSQVALAGGSAIPWPRGNAGTDVRVVEASTASLLAPGLWSRIRDPAPSCGQHVRADRGSASRRLDRQRLRIRIFDPLRLPVAAGEWLDSNVVDDHLDLVLVGPVGGLHRQDKHAGATQSDWVSSSPPASRSWC